MLLTILLLDFFIKLRGKYDIEDVSPIKALAQYNGPILTVHGSADNYVPYYMADIKLKSVAHENKHLYAPDAKHACSVKHDPVKYEKQVKAFLQKYDLYFGE